MYIKSVKYKMSKNDDWKTGYVIGKWEGQGKTLLDDNFEHVPKITEDGKEYLAYDIIRDNEKEFNITINV